MIKAEAGAFGIMVGYLRQLQRALEREGITAVIYRREMGSYVELQVAGLSSAITCRNNPQDAGHWWYFQAGKPLVAAGDSAQVRNATQTIQALRAIRGKAP